MTSTSILVTGSSGFLGSKTVSYFMNRNLVGKIYGIDVRPYQTKSKSNKIETFIVNLSSKKQCRILNQIPIDFIIHTAADQSSKSMLKNNISQMKNLIEIAKRKKVKKFIYVSSSWADVNTSASYPKSKKICEELLILSKLPYTIIRPDTLFGKGEWKMEMIKKYSKLGVGIIVGSGNYLRSPTYVYDLVKIFDITIKQIIKSNNKFKFQKIYDIGSPEPYSQNNIVRLIAKYYKKSIIMIHVPKFLAEILFTLQGKLDPKLVRYVEIDRIADIRDIQKDYNFSLLDFKKGLKYLDYDEYKK